VEVSAEQLERIFSRIASQWGLLADTEPHWSVLTNDKYRMKAFQENEEEFYRSGQHVAALVKTFAARNRIPLPKGHALEIGCGTGRVTAALAGIFDRVTAVDISAGHLDLCRAALAKRGIANAQYLHLAGPHSVDTLPACSFLLSTIVLQHNPPPLIAFLLDWFLSKVEPGGAALFQVPTHTPGYTFDVEKYLASPTSKDFEMHCLPMHCVFDLLHKYGFKPLEVIMDTWTGMPGSHTFFAVRPPAEP
jgi:SAM-dependent methyltransferase